MPRFDLYIRSDLAGNLETSRGRTVFVYDNEFRNGVEPTPLSLSMPLAARSHRGPRVEAFLWGLLPDNDNVLKRWATQFQVSLVTPLGLLAAIGRDLPGAVSILRSGEEFDSESGIEWLDDDDVAKLLAQVRKDQTAWLGDGRWSLAGAQAKIALLERDGRWGRPSGSLATNRILKPAIEGLTDHDVNEYVCMVAAQMLGLRVARTRVMAFGEERAIVVDRYDRRASSDQWSIERLHQEDFCQALGVHPANKYQSAQGPSPEDIVRVLRDHVDVRNVEADIALFVDALIFNWLIAAPDAHAKNYSVLLHGGGVRMAPLYDIASSLPYPEFYAPKISMAMKIGTYYRAGVIGVGAWQRFADGADLDPELVTIRARQMSEKIGDAFSEAAHGIEGHEASVAKGLADQVAEWAQTCQRRLG